MTSGHQNDRHRTGCPGEIACPDQVDFVVTQRTEIDGDWSATQHHGAGAASVY